MQLFFNRLQIRIIAHFCPVIVHYACKKEITFASVINIWYMSKEITEPYIFKSDNFFIYEKINASIFNNEFVSEDWIIMIVCTEGYMHIRFSGKVPMYTLNKNDLAFVYSDYSLESIEVSENFVGKMIGCSRQFIKENFPSSAVIWQQALYIHQNIVIHVSESDSHDLEKSYRFLKDMLTKTDLVYYNNIINRLSQSITFQLASILDNIVDMKYEDRDVQSKDILCHKFLDLLVKTHPRPRSVNWYSEQLHKTPKYLSSVVKEVSGKTASEWIRDAVCIEIADLLRNSPKSIKEICYDLDFPNLSFFGRYVRTHLGMSPKEYRKQKRVENK